MVTDIYQKEEGEFLQPMNIPNLLDDLITSPTGGLDPHNANAAHDYLDILIYALKVQSARSLSILLTVVLNTTSKSLLTAIFLKKKGLQVLAAMLIILQHSFQMTPILRLTLRVLQHLENRQVLRGAKLTCSAPHFCTHDFSQILYDLTKHSDPQVQALAKTFQKVRFHMPRCHRTHNKCQHA